MRALTGVGPAIASGNQIYNGIWADFPTAPKNSRSVIQKIVLLPGSTMAAALGSTSPNVRLPNVLKIRSIATRNPKSPTRFTMNAFLAASLVVDVPGGYPPVSNCRSCQKPIRR